MKVKKNATYITPTELAERWRYTQDHLANLRRVAKGPRFLKLVETGGIRYSMADVIDAEIRSTKGRLTVDDLALAISACAAVPEEIRVAIIEHVRSVLKVRLAKM